MGFGHTDVCSLGALCNNSLATLYTECETPRRQDSFSVLYRPVLPLGFEWAIVGMNN